MMVGVRTFDEARVFDSKVGFHPFICGDGEPSGSFEVFWHDGCDDMRPGWYWWTCFPGCLPDGDAVGPFGSSIAAWCDADEE